MDRNILNFVRMPIYLADNSVIFYTASGSGIRRPQAPKIWVLGMLRQFGGRGVRAFHFGKKDFELGVGMEGKARTRPDI